MIKKLVKFNFDSEMKKRKLFLYQQKVVKDLGYRDLRDIKDTNVIQTIQKLIQNQIILQEEEQ